MTATRTASLVLAAAALWSGCATRRNVPVEAAPPVTPPPASFFQGFSERDREAARQFYKKHLELKGVSIAASGEVSDAALERAYYIVGHMLAAPGRSARHGDQWHALDHHWKRPTLQ